MFINLTEHVKHRLSSTYNSIYLSPLQDSSPLSGFKETGLPKRLLQAGNDGQDLSERVPPPRSSSPVIGSPPVRVVPIGTPPKQPVSHTINHQVKSTQIFKPLFNFCCSLIYFYCYYKCSYIVSFLYN